MTKPSVVHLSVNTSLALEPFQLGVYVKGKALLALGRRAFSISNIGGDKDLAREAIGRLMALGLVEHRGGGWYALAKVPARMIEASSDMGVRMANVAGTRQAPPKSTPSRLRDAIREYSEKLCGYSLLPSAFTIGTSANKVRYQRVVRVISGTNSTITEFIRFVSQQDWSWTQEGYPKIQVLCTDEFLDKFRWYTEHKDEVEQAAEILTIYDRAFSIVGEHKYDEHLLVLKLRTVLSERGITFEAFFRYAASIPWRSFGGFPPVKFLSSDGFVSQASNALPGRARVAQRAEVYLRRIIDRLGKVSFPLSAVAFEDHNWSIGEAVFEPLASFTNNSDQLGTFVARVVECKDEPSLGFYLVTYDGELTPLAVYWIVFASRHMGNSFYFGRQSWKDAVREVAADTVNLGILEAQL